MFEITKLSETCYICEDVGLAIINSVDSLNWFVIDKGSDNKPSKVVFGPSVFEQCRIFVETVFLGEDE